MARQRDNAAKVRGRVDIGAAGRPEGDVAGLKRGHSRREEWQGGQVEAWQGRWCMQLLANTIWGIPGPLAKSTPAV